MTADPYDATVHVQVACLLERDPSIASARVANTGGGVLALLVDAPALPAVLAFSNDDATWALGVYPRLQGKDATASFWEGDESSISDHDMPLVEDAPAEVVAAWILALVRRYPNAVQPDFAAALRLALQASCHHFVYLWVNDRRQAVVERLVAFQEARPCEHCLWGRPYSLPRTELKLFTAWK
jgi:hypothetical protein